MSIDRRELPNILTIFRIALIPLIIVSFYVPWKITNIVVAFLFMLASITDYFDGYFARLYKVQSNFGRCFDPIADKLLVSVSLIMLVNFSNSVYILIPSIVIICREVLVSGLREFLATINVGVPVTKLAKWKTTFQMIAITALLLASKNSSYTYESIMDFFEVEPLLRISFNGVIEKIGTILLNVSAILTIVTGYAYCMVGLKHM
ncbi:MAG: CDP-diacylglycerol--glycerol-3-phosphate 3-phosphatidyltransferase [Rickettsiales bacterium]|nr:CDP-diacylglycerol--glycerol-3-phosphate 3-phosphatidyltransferase [Rickettsiales bacterium]